MPRPLPRRRYRRRPPRGPASPASPPNNVHSAKKVFALPSPIRPSEKPPSGHHLYLSLDPEFDGENDFEGLILCGDGLGRRIYCYCYC